MAKIKRHVLWHLQLQQSVTLIQALAIYAMPLIENEEINMFKFHTFASNIILYAHITDEFKLLNNKIIGK